MPTGGDDVIRCSFCSRTAHEVTSMVAGPDVYICDRCIHDASGIVRGDLQPYVPAASGRGATAVPGRGRRLTPRAPFRRYSCNSSVRAAAIWPAARF